MTDLMELASRVEAGEGPDRELDAAIWLHLPEQEGHAWKHGGDRYKHAHQIAGCSFVPAYTASTDAAMSLLEDYRQTGPNQFGFAPSLLRRHDGTACADVHISPSGDMVSAQGATPALALCCAALRARAHQGAAHADQ